MPSLYLRQEIKKVDRVGFVKGRVSEALRMAEKNSRKQRVLPYHWFKYQDHRDNFLTKVSFFDLFGDVSKILILIPIYLFAQEDTKNTINTVANLGADGVIIWGSSEDTNSEEKCKDLQQYVKDVLGPAIKRIKQQ